MNTEKEMERQIIEVLRYQSICRALGEIAAAMNTFFEGESESSKLYEALDTARREINKNW